MVGYDCPIQQIWQREMGGEREWWDIKSYTNGTGIYFFVFLSLDFFSAIPLKWVILAVYVAVLTDLMVS